jgi:hypothetical protein
MAQWKKKKTIFTDELCTDNFGLKADEKRNIYLNMNYSPSIRTLLYEARKMKQHGFKISYVYKNDVYIKRNPVDEAIKVPNKDFLQQINNINLTQRCFF